MPDPFVLRWSEVQSSLEALKARLANPKPVLREYSRRFIKRIRRNIAAGGSGWPGKALSTLKREQSTGTSQVTVRRTIRSDRVRRTANEIQNLLKKVREEGWNDRNRKKYARLAKRLANYKRAEERAKKRKSAPDIGKRQSEGRQMMHNMPGTFRSKFDGNILLTYSAANLVGAAHNYGEGREPKREMIPPPDMAESLDELAELMESDLGQAWEKGRG